MSCQSLQKFESILLLTLTVSIHEYEGYHNGLPSPAEEARIKLENLIATEIHDTNVDPDFDDTDENKEITNIINDIDEENEESYNDDVHQWIENLKI